VAQSVKIIDVLAVYRVKTRRSMSLLRTKIMSSLIGGVILSAALSGCGTTRATKVEHKSDPAVDMSGKVQSLQRQIQERDKRIEELESQLDALKLIDEDREKQRKPLRPPMILEPSQ
jgi:predicted RNase H-like nuclease (RuvC/YqgF family)